MSTIRGILKKKTNREYSIDFNVTYDEWVKYFSATYFSNLLQSWGYGETKVMLDGWKAHRAVIKKDGTPVAICQLLEKSVGSLFKIIRINRGPLFLTHHEPDFQDRLLLYDFIRRQFSFSKRCLLSIAPPLEDNIENRILLKTARFRRREKKIGWKSSLIDLRKTEPELRAALKSRLRNYLKHAENANLIFSISIERRDFEDIFIRYVKMQKEKNFSGVSVNCMRLLQKMDNTKGDVFLAVAKNLQGEPVALKLIVIHGAQATPLIAWTSKEGGALHAMHFLMWRTLLYLKGYGVVYFDVGGYHENERASVCQFKKSFGGVEYNLVGEYWGF